MLKFKELPPLEALQKNFAYQPDTGHLIYIGRQNSNARKGQIAGHVEKAGYLVVSFKQCKYKAHRVAWLLHTGEDPGPHLDIDHIDGCRTNNRFDNLRVVTRFENNRAMRERNAKRKRPPEETLNPCR